MLLQRKKKANSLVPAIFPPLHGLFGKVVVYFFFVCLFANFGGFVLNFG